MSGARAPWTGGSAAGAAAPASGAGTAARRWATRTATPATVAPTRLPATRSLSQWKPRNSETPSVTATGTAKPSTTAPGRSRGPVHTCTRCITTTAANAVFDAWPEGKARPPSKAPTTWSKARPRSMTTLAPHTTA